MTAGKTVRRFSFMKKLLWIVLFGTMITCFASAQEFEFNFQNSFSAFETASFGFESGTQLDLLAESGRKPTIGVPILAGLLNTLFGTWSWMNQDWVGGGITAGLEAGGIAIMVMSLVKTNSADPDTNTLKYGFQALGGAAVYLGGAIYGLVRGISYCKKMNSNAVAWTGNPADHITIAAMPASDGGFTGNLTFKMAY